jgi:alkyl hydroperoxide reductase subunit F
VKQAANLTLYLEHEVLEIKGDKLVKSIRVRNLNTREILELQVGGVFIEIGLIPNSNPVRELLRLNQWGEIVINCSNETSIPGVFAAGDVTDVPEKQIVVASGEGAKAALQAHRYIQRLVNGPR